MFDVECIICLLFDARCFFLSGGENCTARGELNQGKQHVVSAWPKIVEMDKLSKIGKNKHFKFGAPFVIMIVGSAYGLKYYSEVRFQLQEERHIMSKTKELQKLTTKQHTIEEEYEDYKKTVDLDDWKNIRGPRPWESDNQEYKELIERRAKESKDQWIFKN